MKLTIRRYNEKFSFFTLVFDLLRHAVQELGNAGFRRFVENARKPGQANFQKMLSILAVDHADLIPLIQSKHKQKLSRSLPITPNLKWTEYKGHAQYGLNASELILRVALFESFMKQIHQHVLLSEPKLLVRAKPNRSIQLKELFRQGFERFKGDETLRQVREADRMRTKDRAKFFQRTLRLPWGDQTTIDRVCELLDLRHEIVHSTPDLDVHDRDIADTRRFLLAIPQSCVTKAIQFYPSHFEK
jgi:hypothetical protein